MGQAWTCHLCKTYGDPDECNKCDVKVGYIVDNRGNEGNLETMDILNSKFPLELGICQALGDGSKVHIFTYICGSCLKAVEAECDISGMEGYELYIDKRPIGKHFVHM